MNYAASFSSSDQDGNSSDDSEVDETLVRELRESLHFSIGKICRAEELAAKKDHHDKRRDNDSFASSDNDDDMMMTTEEKATKKAKETPVMNKEAISALTELVYHYATSSLASDLSAFSNHANRRTVKVEDVLLVARKEKHLLAELKRKVAVDQKSSESGNNNKGTANSATAAAVGNRQKKKKNSVNNNKRSKGGSKNALFNSGKKKSTTSSFLDSSSSSSSSSESDDQDPIEKMKQRRLELKQKNLNRTAFDRAKKYDDSSSSSNSSSSSSGGDVFNIRKSTKTDNGKSKKKSSNLNGTDDMQDDMVIDLAESD